MENFGSMKYTISLLLLHFSWHDKLSNILVREVNTVLTDIEFVVITYQVHCLTPSLVLKFCANLIRGMKE